MSTKGPQSTADGPLSDNASGEKSKRHRSCEAGSRGKVFSQALSNDGALTWDVPQKLNEERLIPSTTEGNSQIVFDDVHKAHRQTLDPVYSEHMSQIVDQLLKGEGVPNPEVWKSIIMKLSKEAASMISPQLASQKGVLDPRQHIQVEVLPDQETPSESSVVQGVILRKNIAHKGMRSNIKNPRVLLLAGALELEPSKLEALNTIVQQELSFLESAVALISKCKPDLLVVERNVARFAIQALESKGIALVYNVTSANLQRLALNLDTQVVKSISHIADATLGSCGEFNVSSVRNTAKPGTRPRRARIPLMKFTECPNRLSSFIVLKGEPQEKLDILVKIVSMATCTAYHHHLESAFLTDELTCASTSLAAVVKGFPPQMDFNQWRGISRVFVGDSVNCVRSWHPVTQTTTISPHIAGWTAEDSRSPIEQSSNYSTPSFDSCKHLHPNQLSEMDCVLKELSLRSEPTLSHLDSDFVHAQTECMEHTLDSASQDDSRALPDCANFQRLDTESQSATCDMLRTAYSIGNGQEDNPISQRSSSGTVYHLSRGASVASSTFASACDPDESWTLKGQAPSEPVHRNEELLRIYNSQKFTSNFANRNHRKGLLCEPAHVQTMDFYGENDCSLEAFLMSIAADATKRCPQGCGGGNSSHVRTFLHGGMRLTVSVVSLPIGKEFPEDGQLWFWARPKGLDPNPLESVRRTPLSPDAKCISLGQFLDLSCNAHYLKVFERQLHLEFVRYFGYGRTVACVYQDRIRPYSISLPDLKLESSLQSLVQWLKDAHAELIQESAAAYHAIEESLNCTKGECEELVAVEKATKSRWVPQIHQEHDQFRDRLNRVIYRVCNGTKVTEHFVLNCILDLNQLRRQLAVNLLTWSAKLQDPSMYAVDIKTHVEDRPDTPLSGIGTQFVDVGLIERSQSIGADMMMQSQEADGLEIPGGSHFNDIDGLEGNPVSGGWSPFSSANLWDDIKYGDAIDHLSEPGNLTDDSGRKFTSPFAALIDRPFSPESSSSWGSDSEISLEVRPSLEVPSFGHGSSLERLPAISPDQDVLLFPSSIRQNSSVGDLHALLDQEASRFLEDSKLILGEEAHHRRWASDPIAPKEISLLDQLGRRLVRIEDMPYCSAPPQHSDVSVSNHKMDPILRVTPQLRQHLKSGMIPLANGFFQINGRSLITSPADDVVIPFFEAEPASVIAHVLASFAYQKDLQVGVEKIIATGSSNSTSDLKVGCKALGGHCSILLSKHPVHLVQKFEDDPPGMPWSQAKFQVVAYYAPQFAKLRELCIAGGERSFILSLSRCKRWDAQGGKSNAYFAKTQDDRYIIKSLSKPEKTSLIENFGPAYFKHINEAYEENRQIALAKILGVFQVSMKSKPDVPSDNPLGKDWTLDVIVMENVFYNRNMDRTYDLKGSRRSRFSSEAEENPSDKGTVYLDSNLRKHNLSAPPLLVDRLSLEGLTIALQRDSHFLAKQLIMDYSLLVGLDKDNSTLVVAIIDYVRQYTWDKRLESLAKSSGIIGNKSDVGEEPTVISPDSYMKRFVTTITSYFHVVPTSNDDLLQEYDAKGSCVWEGA